MFLPIFEAPGIKQRRNGGLKIEKCRSQGAQPRVSFENRRAESFAASTVAVPSKSAARCRRYEDCGSTPLSRRRAAGVVDGREKIRRHRARKQDRFPHRLGSFRELDRGRLQRRMGQRLADGAVVIVPRRRARRMGMRAFRAGFRMSLTAVAMVMMGTMRRGGVLMLDRLRRTRPVVMIVPRRSPGDD